MSVDKSASVLEFARAIADQTREEIMRLCCCQWLSVNEITEQTHVEQPTVSHHLAVLRKAGLVKVRREGRQVFYTLNQDKVVSCCGRLMVTFAPEAELTQKVGDELKAD